MKDSAKAISAVNRSIAVFMSFLKDTVRNNTVHFCRSKKIDVSDRDLRMLLATIDNSIEQAFTNGYSSVQKTLKEHLVDNKE